jgi:metallo-beta-lactamase family protein
MSQINAPRLRFLGGAQTVTGSKYLLTYNEKKILVDCGLFQGVKELRLKNWDRFPIDPKMIDAVVLTHAHIDHSGYIPRLIKEGFTGKIFCTNATLALCRILLPDTGYIQEEEADYLNRRNRSKHVPALPLFNKQEAEQALRFFSPQDFDKEFEVAPGFRAKFLYAGHILGAAQVVLNAGDRKIGFSGDLGRQNDPILFAPANMEPVDYLVTESTYGDRKHEAADPLGELEKIIQEAERKKGVILIPAFTVGRAQSLIYFL